MLKIPGYAAPTAPEKIAPVKGQHTYEKFNFGFYASWGGLCAIRTAENVIQGAQLADLSSSAQVVASTASQATAVIAAAGGALGAASGIFSIVEVGMTTHAQYKTVLNARECFKALSKNKEGHTHFATQLNQPESKIKWLATDKQMATDEKSPLPKSEEVKAFCAYESAAIDKEAHLRAIQSESVNFARDGLIQAANVGTSFARLAAQFIPGTVVNVGAASIAGGAFSIALGLGQCVGATIAYRTAKSDMEASKASEEIIDKLQSELDEKTAMAHPKDLVDHLLIDRKTGMDERKAKYERAAAKNSEMAQLLRAIELNQTLLKLAAENERNTQIEAKGKKSMAKRRMAFGSVYAIVGVISLAVFLALGSNPVGLIVMLVLGTIALLAATSWLAYASTLIHRRLKAKPALALRKQEVDKAVAKAMDLLTDRDTFLGRKLLKATLLRMGGLHESPFLLKAKQLGAETEAKELLKKRIGNLINGDGIRRRVKAEAAERRKAEAAERREIVSKKANKLKEKIKKTSISPRWHNNRLGTRPPSPRAGTPSFCPLP